MSIHSKEIASPSPEKKRPRATARQPFDPQRRADILRCAVQVFARKGFQRSTIRDIAREAGLADGTIYNHFENKNALLLALLDGMNQTERREADFEAADHESLEQFMQRYFRQRLDALEEGGGAALGVILAELLTNAELRETYAQQLVAPTFAVAERAFGRWAEQGRISAERQAVTVRLLAALFLGVVVLRLLGDEMLKAQWATLPEALTDLVLHGVTPPNTETQP